MCPTPAGRKVSDTPVTGTAWFRGLCVFCEEAATPSKTCVRHLEGEKCRTPDSGSDGAVAASPARTGHGRDRVVGRAFARQDGAVARWAAVSDRRWSVVGACAFVVGCRG